MAQVQCGTDYDALSYEVINCPSAVVDRARVFLSAAGLHYGAFGGPARFPGSHGFPEADIFYAGLIGP